jgi:hypothetical protein
MPDARFKSEWLHNSAWIRLLDFEKQSFFAALVWCAGEYNNGVIGHDDLDLIPDFEKSAIPALVGLKHLKETRTGWVMTPFGAPWKQSQITKKQHEQYVEMNRLRQAKFRASQKAKAAAEVGETDD